MTVETSERTTTICRRCSQAEPLNINGHCAGCHNHNDKDRRGLAHLDGPAAPMGGTPTNATATA